MQEAAEKVAEAEAAGREAAEENKRLQDHIHDLETRKRAPLYQKRQEEELRAALEKGAEADARAQDAETRAKEAKVTRHICVALFLLKEWSCPEASLCRRHLRPSTRQYLSGFQPSNKAWRHPGIFLLRRMWVCNHQSAHAASV